MKRFKRLVSFLLVVVMILGTVSTGFAADTNKSDIRTGFYVKGAAGENTFIDIYTYLNNKTIYLPIISAGLGDVLFVHQDGTGAKLSEILEDGEIKTKTLTEADFEEEYKNAGNVDETLKPKDFLFTFAVALDKAEYTVDEEIILTGSVEPAEENVDITITIKSGKELVAIEQLKTAADGKFTLEFQVPEETEPGTYTLTVRANEPVKKTIVLNLVIVSESTDDTIPAAIINEMADKIAEVFINIDELDKEDIRDAKANLNLITDEQWDTILVDILTDEVVANFADEATATDALKSAILELANITYSLDTTSLRTSLTTYAETYLPTFRAIFGYEESAEVLFSLFKDIITNIPNAITPSQGNALVGAADEYVIGIIEEIAKTTVSYTLNLIKYQGFKGRLSEVGLSVDTLIDVRSKLATIIDTNNAAQIALINAYARSQAKLTGLIEVKAEETLEYTLTVLGKDVSTLVNWSNSDEEVATIAVDEKVVLTALAEGTTTITVYRGTDEANWIAKFEVTVLPADVVVDKALLEAEIALVGALVETNYTAESWAVLQDALSAANEVITNREATQEEVNIALETLTTVKKALEDKPVEPIESIEAEETIETIEPIEAEETIEPIEPIEAEEIQ